MYFHGKWRKLEQKLSLIFKLFNCFLDFFFASLNCVPQLSSELIVYYNLVYILINVLWFEWLKELHYQYDSG